MFELNDDSVHAFVVKRLALVRDPEFNLAPVGNHEYAHVNLPVSTPRRP